MDQLLDELPDEVAEMLARHEAERIVRLESFSQMVAKKRDEAITARANSGVEQTWLEDDDHYYGVDSANRNRDGATKPMHPTAGFTPSKQKTDGRSTLFLNITRPYVDAIVARTCDILLPTDDKNWGIEPTPIPELINAPVSIGAPSMPGATMPPPPGAAPFAPATPDGAPPQAVTPPAPIDPLVTQTNLSRDAAERAEKRISDWLAETGFNLENRKTIFSAAKLGTGILKGPFPVRCSTTAVTHTPEGVSVVISQVLKPSSKDVSVWNFFPDPACGENIHNGNYVFEVDYLTAKSLRELKGTPGYISDAIEKVLAEGPNGDTSENGFIRNPNRPRVTEKDLFAVWYGYMAVEKSDLEAAGVDVDDLESGSIHAIVTMVNNTVIKACVNPLESGAFPYDVMCWQPVSGQWAGVGVSRQVRAAQQMLNAANRNMMDNAGLSGGPILIVRQNMIVPADGDWTLRPRKVFYTTADADVRTVNDAITAINIPSMQAELMNIITFAMKTAELVTGFPLLMQGQNSQSTPDTYGGQILATNNASTVLRHVARTYDGSITVPKITRYYEYLLTYGDDEREKGEFKIVARGSTALVEQEIHAQEMTQLIQLSANPAFGLDPKKLMAEYFKSRRFDPRKFQYSDEEQARMAQQPAQPPIPIAVAQIKSEAEIQAAQIRAQAQVDVVKTEAQLEIEAAQAGHLSPQMASAQARIAEATIRANSEQAKEQSRANTELAYVESQARMAMVNDQANLRELELKKEIALLEYSAKHQLTLEQTKTQLATVAMQEGTKRQLAAAKLQMDMDDYERDRQQDSTKHVENIISNQETAAEARRAEAEKQRREHVQQLKIEKMKLKQASKKARDVPGKKY